MVPVYRILLDEAAAKQFGKQDRVGVDDKCGEGRPAQSYSRTLQLHMIIRTRAVSSLSSLAEAAAIRPPPLSK